MKYCKGKASKEQPNKKEKKNLKERVEEKDCWELEETQVSCKG